MTDTRRPLEHTDIGPAELYINGKYVGKTQETSELDFPETNIKPKYGIPAGTMGTITTEIGGTLSVPCCYIDPENFEILTGGELEEYDDGDQSLSFGGKLIKPVIYNAVLHHHNKIQNRHEIYALWIMQSTGGLKRSFVSANPTGLMVLNMNFEMIADYENHPDSPIAQIWWSDSFNLDDLPWNRHPSPEPPGPEPPGPEPESHEIENETIALTNHAGTLSKGKVSSYVLKDNLLSTTLTEGEDYSIDTNTGEVTMIEGSDYYDAPDIRASFTWWDNRTAVSAEEATSIDAGGGNYRYELAHSPIENAGTLVVTDSTGSTTYEEGTDYNVNYASGVLFASSGSMAAANYTVKASYYYYSNNE